MKFLLFCFLSISVTFCQLFDQRIPSVIPAVQGFDNFDTLSPINQPHFLQEKTYENENIANTLNSQAENLIQETENKAVETEEASEKKRLNEMSAVSLENSEINNLTVNNLNVHTNLRFAGGITIEKNGIKVTNETNFFLDNNTFSFEKLLHFMNFAEKISSLCGENLENCPGLNKKEEANRQMQEKSKFRMKQRNNGRFLQMNTNKNKESKAKGKQLGLSDEYLVSNSIDLDTSAKEKEVENAVESVLSDEQNLHNYGAHDQE